MAINKQPKTPSSAPAPRNIKQYNIMDELKINLKVRWIIAIVGGLITSGSFFAYWMYASNPALKDGGIILAAGISATSLVYTAVSFQANYRINELRLRREKVAESFSQINTYQERESSRFSILLKACGKGKLRELDQKIVAQVVTENTEARIAVLSFLNFFENMNLSIEKDFSDESTLRDFFCDIVNISYHLLASYISIRRAEHNSAKMFRGYEALAQRWSHDSGAQIEHISEKK